MLTVDINVKDRLINGQMGIVKYFKIIQNLISILFIEFEMLMLVET